MRYVILGNGAAGVNAIEAIRKVDPEGEIVNITSEPYKPYSKPVMPHYVGGQIPYKKMFFRPDDFYETNNVTPILGDGAIGIDVDNCYVILKSGRRIRYDKLLIATGSKPREMRVPGVELDGIFYLTSMEYTERIVDYLPNVRKALVLGGGPLGLKASLSLSHHGIEVKLLISSNQVMSQVLDPDSAKILEKKLDESEVDMKLKSSVIAFEGRGRVEYALLDSGERLPCDMVIIAKGVVPNYDFIDRRKIRANVGIIVNSYMQTSVSNIYAAGDVAEAYDLLTGGNNTVAVWPRASEQGYFAGMNMAGFEKPYPGAHRMNSLDFEGVSCIVMGDVKTVKEGFVVLTQKDVKRNIYQRIILEGGKIRGAAIIGRIVNVGGINRFIRKRVPVERIKDSLLEDRVTFIY